LRSRLVFLLLLGLLAIVAGCGGSSKKASETVAAETTTETTTAAETTTEATTTAETQTEAVTTTETLEPATTEATATATTSGSTSFASSKNCLKLLGISEAFAKAFAQSGQKNDFEAQAKLLESFADKAPDEIKSDFKLFAAEYGKFIREYGKLHIKAGVQPTPQQIAKLQEISQSFSAPALTKASAHITAWVQKNCSKA
jgi:hypothetical protein